MSPVWSIPTYDTDLDAWRARIEAKRERTHALWASNEAARESQRGRTVRPVPAPTPATKPAPRPSRKASGATKPCPGCHRPTRPSKTNLADYPGTVQRFQGGMCHACWNAEERANRPPIHCRNCDKEILGARVTRLFCSDACRKAHSRKLRSAA